MASLSSEDRAAFELFREWRRRRAPHSRKPIPDHSPRRFLGTWHHEKAQLCVRALAERGWLDRIGEYVAVQFEAMEHLGKPGAVALAQLDAPHMLGRFERFLSRSYVQKTAGGTGAGFRPTETTQLRMNAESLAHLLAEHQRHAAHPDPLALAVSSFRMVAPETATALESIYPGYLQALWGCGNVEAAKLSRQARGIIEAQRSGNAWAHAAVGMAEGVLRKVGNV